MIVMFIEQCKKYNYLLFSNIYCIYSKFTIFKHEYVIRDYEDLETNQYFFLPCRCNTKWYNAPLKAQKLILFLLQKTTKTYRVDAGGMFSPCLEGLVAVRSHIIIGNNYCMNNCNV